MNAITDIVPRLIYDSRSAPTLEVDVLTAEGHRGRASSPSGAAENIDHHGRLRDGQRHDEFTLVRHAIKTVRSEVRPLLLGHEVTDQIVIDDKLHSLLRKHASQGPFWPRFAISVSVAVARAAAHARGVKVFEYVEQYLRHPLASEFTLPVPMLNVINGGTAGSPTLAFQAFMIVPVIPESFTECVRAGAEIFHCLGEELENLHLDFPVGVGEEGGYAPVMRREESQLSQCSRVLDAILSATERAHYRPGTDVAIALDAAVSRYFDPERRVYRIGEEEFTTENLIDLLEELTRNYPIVSLEDPLAADDIDGWRAIYARLGHRIVLVGDDLYASQISRLETLSRQYGTLAHTFLIMPDRIGSLTQSISAVENARILGLEPVVSHRSGETEDTMICDLCVGTRMRAIKAGGMARAERTEKYNELMRIESFLRHRGSRPTLAYSSIPELRDFRRLRHSEALS
jgi:enolase